MVSLWLIVHFRKIGSYIKNVLFASNEALIKCNLISATWSYFSLSQTGENSLSPTNFCSKREFRDPCSEMPFFPIKVPVSVYHQGRHYILSILKCFRISSAWLGCAWHVALLHIIFPIRWWNWFLHIHITEEI